MTTTSAAGPRQTAGGRLIAGLAPIAGVAIVLVAAAVTTPDFYNHANLTLVLFQAGLIGVTAVGQTFVLLAAGIDLSIGAVIGLTTVIVAAQTDRRAGPLPGAIVLALLAVFGGLIDAAYVGHVDAQLSRSLNLDSIAAAVIGGVALTGGQGHIGQTVAGVLLLAVLLVWMLQLGAGAGGQLAVEGAAILLAAWLQQRASSTRLGRSQGGGQ